MTDSSPAKNNALILVVERDPHMQALERYFLSQAGYEAVFVADGKQALERARELHPRILISEILVPGVDGLSVCRQLKADPETRDILVLVFSILAAEEQALAAGADDFLRKPLNDAVLVSRVERLLTRHRRAESEHG